MGCLSPSSSSHMSGFADLENQRHVNHICWHQCDGGASVYLAIYILNGQDIGRVGASFSNFPNTTHDTKNGMSSCHKHRTKSQQGRYRSGVS